MRVDSWACECVRTIFTRVFFFCFCIPGMTVPCTVFANEGLLLRGFLLLDDSPIHCLCKRGLFATEGLCCGTFASEGPFC